MVNAILGLGVTFFGDGVGLPILGALLAKNTTYIFCFLTFHNCVYYSEYFDNIMDYFGSHLLLYLYVLFLWRFFLVCFCYMVKVQ